MSKNTIPNVEVIGWMHEKLQPISHYWKGRTGFETVVSSCGLISRRGKLTINTKTTNCPACTVAMDVKYNDFLNTGNHNRREVR